MGIEHSPLSGAFIRRTGDIMSGELVAEAGIVLANGQALKGRDAGGTARSLLSISPFNTATLFDAGLMGLVTNDSSLYQSAGDYPVVRRLTPGTGTYASALIAQARKTADESVNNSTTLQPDDELLLSVGANEVWSVLVYLRYSGVGSGDDLKLGWAVPTGASMQYLALGYDSADALALQAVTNAVLGTVAGERRALLLGHYLGGASAGTLQLQWSQNVATVGNTTVVAGSYLLAQRMA